MDEDQEVVTKEFVCPYPNCGRGFNRACDLNRHERSHLEPEEREFGCPLEGCNRRFNQKCGLKSHLDSGQHNNKRSACPVPGCKKTFADPAGVSKHKRADHGMGPKRRRQRPFVASPSRANPSFAQASSSSSSSSSSRGGVHTADVSADYRSIDKNQTIRHQAYNANQPQAAPTASGNHPRLPEPQLRLAVSPRASPANANLSQVGRTHPSDVGRTTFAPGGNEQTQTQPQRQPFQSIGIGHDRILPPIPPHRPSSVKFRPNPDFLFGTSSRNPNTVRYLNRYQPYPVASQLSHFMEPKFFV